MKDNELIPQEGMPLLFNEIENFLEEKRQKTEINLKPPKMRDKLFGKLKEITSTYYFFSAVCVTGLGIMAVQSFGLPGLYVGAVITSVGVTSLSFKIATEN